MIRIVDYDFDPRIVEAFSDLRAELYRNELMSAEEVERSRAMFSPEASFYRRAANDHRHFAAWRGARLVGHVSAFVNAELFDDDGVALGALGLFECVEDPEVAQRLLSVGIAWLESVGRGSRIWAPVDFDIWHRYRLKTQGFSWPPYLGEPRNKPYYARQFEVSEFQPRARWHSIEVVGEGALRALAASALERFRERSADGYRFEVLDPGDETEVRALHGAIMAAYGAFPGFTAQPFDEFFELHAATWQRLDSQFASVVRDPVGDVVGFSLAYPDPGAEPPRVVYYMIGITPDESARRHGLGRASYFYTMRRILDAGYQRVLFALLREDSRSRSLVARHTSEAQMEYALYQRGAS